MVPVDHRRHLMCVRVQPELYTLALQHPSQVTHRDEQPFAVVVMQRPAEK